MKGGTMKGIDQRIAELSPEKLGLLLERLESARPAREESAFQSRVRPRRRDTGVRPMSFAQERLWFLDQLSPGNSDYNVSEALRLQGGVDRGLFARALNEIVRRHELLRASFRSVDGGPVEEVQATLRVTPARVDLRGLFQPHREAEVERLARCEALHPFDLTRAPLLRVCWLELAEDDQVLLFTLHHIVCDAWSIGVLVGELVELYQAFRDGESPPLAEPVLQYADYAEWHRERLQGDDLQRLLSYWRRQLQGATSTIGLHGALPERPGSERRGIDKHFSIPPQTAVELQALAREERTTSFILLASLFSALLHAESGQTDLCIGANVAHRGDLETQRLVGFFINQVVLRVRPRPAESFRELVRQVRDVTEAAHAHQDLPFEMMVEALCPERSAGRNPLFQVKVDFHEDLLPVRWPGVELSALETVPTPLRCDLLLAGMSSEEEIVCTLSYDSSRFRDETIEEMAAQLVQIARIAGAEPEIRLHELSERVGSRREEERAADRERLDRIGARKLNSTRRKGVGFLSSAEEAR